MKPTLHRAAESSESSDGVKGSHLRPRPLNLQGVAEDSMWWSTFMRHEETASPYQITALTSKKHTTPAHEVGHMFMV